MIGNIEQAKYLSRIYFISNNAIKIIHNIE